MVEEGSTIGSVQGENEVDLSLMRDRVDSWVPQRSISTKRSPTG